MTMRRLGVTLLLVAMGGLGGCATITRGTTEVLVVNSDPSGAQVQISDGHSCVTPCSVELKRKHDYHVKVEKAGYETVDTDVLSQVVGAGAAGMAGNVLIGGLIGAGVDLATGATKGLKPNPLDIKMNPAAPLTQTVLQQAAATTSALTSVGVENMCTQASKVDQAECSGMLKLGMTEEQVVAVLGVPSGKSADEKTLHYDDRDLEFDGANQLVKVSEVKVQ